MRACLVAAERRGMPTILLRWQFARSKGEFGHVTTPITERRHKNVLFVHVRTPLRCMGLFRLFF